MRLKCDTVYDDEEGKNELKMRWRRQRWKRAEKWWSLILYNISSTTKLHTLQFIYISYIHIFHYITSGVYGCNKREAKSTIKFFCASLCIVSVIPSRKKSRRSFLTFLWVNARDFSFIKRTKIHEKKTNSNVYISNHTKGKAFYPYRLMKASSLGLGCRITRLKPKLFF